MIVPKVGSYYQTQLGLVRVAQLDRDGYAKVFFVKSPIMPVTIHESAFHLETDANGNPLGKPLAPPAQKLTMNGVVDRVLADFDFERVRVVMDILDWKWAHSRTQDEIPSVGELVTVARSLLVSAYSEVQKTNKSEDRYAVATGGFAAEAERYEDGEIVLTLKFVVTDTNWSTADTCY